MADVKTMDQLVERVPGRRPVQRARSSGPSRASPSLLAAVGIYGVMSFVVAQRTHEIGLRMALGAGRAQVVRQILQEGMARRSSGVAIGTAGRLSASGRAMQGMVVGVGAMDPVAFGVVATLLLTSAAAGLPGSGAPRGVGRSDDRPAPGLSVP